jgi:hypothetical protein
LEKEAKEEQDGADNAHLLGGVSSPFELGREELLPGTPSVYRCLLCRSILWELREGAWCVFTTLLKKLLLGDEERAGEPG